MIKSRKLDGQRENYNLLKILAIFMVVAVHMMNVVELVPPGDMGAFRLHEAVRTFLLTSNGLFFMISGRFLLEHYDGKIFQFYWKRIVKIGIPVLVISFFYYGYVYGKEGMGAGFWKSFAKELLQSHIQGYLWFVYALAGFYLAVPFLAPMLKGLGKKEKGILIGVTMVYFLVQNCYQIFNLEMVLTSYPFYSWVFYCMLGYLLDSMELSKQRKELLMLAGILAYQISVWEICFWQKENPAIHNYSVTMLLLTAAVYLAVTTYGEKLAERFSLIIHFIASRSFYLYLMHGLTQNIIAGRLSVQVAGGWKSWALWLGLSLLSFVMALGIGCLLELLYRPLSGWLLKKGTFGKEQ